MNYSKLILIGLAIAFSASYSKAEGEFSPFAEVAVFGPYGPGIVVGTFYDNSEVVKYIDGFWGGFGLFWSKEEGLFEDYTETLFELQSGVLLDIPKLNEVENLDVFAGLSIGFRRYEYLDADYSDTIFGVIAGAMYEINDTWSVGGMYSLMTNAPRAMISYTF